MDLEGTSSEKMTVQGCRNQKARGGGSGNLVWILCRRRLWPRLPRPGETCKPPFDKSTRSPLISPCQYSCVVDLNLNFGIPGSDVDRYHRFSIRFPSLLQRSGDIEDISWCGLLFAFGTISGSAAQVQEVTLSAGTASFRGSQNSTSG